MSLPIKSLVFLTSHSHHYWERGTVITLNQRSAFTATVNGLSLRCHLDRPQPSQPPLRGAFVATVQLPSQPPRTRRGFTKSSPLSFSLSKSSPLSFSLSKRDSTSSSSSSIRRRFTWNFKYEQ